MWRSFEVEEDRWYYWSLNGAAIYLCRSADQWRIAARSVLFEDIRPGCDGPGTPPPPKDLPEFLITGAGRMVSLRPYFYEKPYFIKFRDKIHLLPDAEIRLDLALPPVLRLELAGETELYSFTPFLFSETWSGENTMSGSLCLSIPGGSPLSDFTGASAFIRGELIFCNQTKTILDIEHLVLNSNPLNIYEKEGQLRCETMAAEPNGGGELKINLRPGMPDGYTMLTAAKKTGWGISLSAGMWT